MCCVLESLFIPLYCTHMSDGWNKIDNPENLSKYSKNPKLKPDPKTVLKMHAVKYLMMDMEMCL